MAEKITLVLGGTGKTGRRVAERLAARHVPVRIGSRSGQPPFDWSDRSTWPGALHDVSAVYISYYPDLAVPGAGDAVRALIGVALEQGARRLVLLSGRGEAEAEQCEQILQTSGADWTVLRASWFSQNFSEGAFVDEIVAGEITLPAGDVPVPFVDADDIADVAVAAFTDPKHVGQLYELTGPRALTFAEAVAEISQATGRDIRYVSVPPDDYGAALEHAQVPSDFVWLLSYLFREVLVPSNASPGDGVVRALGRPPRDFRDYVRETAATGIWNAAGTAGSAAALHA